MTASQPDVHYIVPSLQQGVCRVLPAGLDAIDGYRIRSVYNLGVASIPRNERSRKTILPCKTCDSNEAIGSLIAIGMPGGENQR